MKIDKKSKMELIEIVLNRHITGFWIALCNHSAGCGGYERYASLRKKGRRSGFEKRSSLAFDTDTGLFVSIFGINR